VEHFRSFRARPSPGKKRPVCQRGKPGDKNHSWAKPVYAPSFFFTSSGTSTLVEPTSLISTVVVRSMLRSSPSRVVMAPEYVVWYLDTTPSFTQILMEPLAFLGAF